MSKTVLIVSPIPSHPQFQGNSARIYRLNRMFQLCGYQVHFLYFGMEGLSETQRRDMESQWDYFHFVQPQGPAAEPSFGEYFDIDDWYDNRVSDYVDKLCETWSFDVCLVNYVWFSKVLDVLPEQTYKVIDTHDVFGNRHIVAKEAGLEPVWFYTTKELEGYGLDRADLVLAIQDKERDYFQSVTAKEVVTMGHVTPFHPLTKRQSQKVVVGYIGSANPFNLESLRIFQCEVLKNAELLEKFKFVLAGTVCKSFEDQNQIFELMGVVDELDSFYRQVDVAVNPMHGGTGLKIKSLEALSYGVGLIATEDAMIGIETNEECHAYSSVDQLVKGLSGLSSKKLRLLTNSSIITHREYNERFLRQFYSTFSSY